MTAYTAYTCCAPSGTALARDACDETASQSGILWRTSGLQQLRMKLGEGVLVLMRHYQEPVAHLGPDAFGPFGLGLRFVGEPMAGRDRSNVGPRI